MKQKSFRSSFIPSAIHHLNSFKVWWQCCQDHKSLVNAALWGWGGVGGILCWGGGGECKGPQEGLLNIIGGSCQKYHFCRDKGFVVTNTCLSWQKYATKLLSWQNIFVVTSILLSQQNLFCHNKSMLVMTIFVVVATNICRDKFCCTKHVCCNKHNFVATKVLLRQHAFVTTKMILVAAPANGNRWGVEKINVWLLMWYNYCFCISSLKTNLSYDVIKFSVFKVVKTWP